MDLHDFGSWIGLRLAMTAPQRVSALIIQNARAARPDRARPVAAALVADDACAPRDLRPADCQLERKPGVVPALPGLPARTPTTHTHRLGPQDGYMPEPSAGAYLRDLPDAELHLLDGGHWLLETSLPEVVSLTRDFLERHRQACGS